MSDLIVEVHKPATRSDLGVVRLEGTLDSYSLGEVEKVLQGFYQENRYNVVVNCEKLKYISSSGLGLFLGTLGEVEKQGGSLCLAEVRQPEVHDAMNLLGFFDIFPIYEKELEAIQKTQKKS